jgi:hypothetical protein
MHRTAPYLLTRLLIAACCAGLTAAAGADPAGHAAAPAPPLDAAQIHAILQAADQARGNHDGIIWTVQVTGVENDTPRANVYAVKARGFDILAEVMEPARQKGNLLLMHLGNMWFTKPDLSKPIPISQRQRLTGIAANGDLAATNYADDYLATLQADTRVDDEPCHVFDLRANNRRCTYDRIVYYVSQARQVGVRSDYYTAGGKQIKTAYMSYTNTLADAAGRTRPFISTIFIRDALATNNTATLNFSPPRLGALTAETFDVNRLRK